MQVGHDEVAQEVWNLPGLVNHTKNYGKSPYVMDKSTINGHFQ